MVTETFDVGASDMRLVETLVTLIPKGENPTHLKSFKPISLCNVANKVISKVLFNKLHPFLKELVGPLQSSFIPNWSAYDNAIIMRCIL